MWEGKLLKNTKTRSREKYLNLDQHVLVGLGRARFSDGKIIDANPTIAKFFGFDDVREFIADFKIGDNYVSANHRKEILAELIENGEIHNIEIEFFRKDGSSFWLMTSIRFFQEEDYNEFLAIDVTNYKRQEEEIRKSRAQLELLVQQRTSELAEINKSLERQMEERNRAEKELESQTTQMDAVLQNIGDGVLAIDREHRIVLANPNAFVYLSALQSRQSHGEKLTSLGDRPIEEFLNPPPKNTVSHEITIEQPEPRVFEVVTHQLKIDGQNKGWIFIIRDLTQKKSIQKHNEVQERLAAIGQLVAGIAHDFNNILFGMMGYTQLLQRMPNMPEAAIQRLNKILMGGEQASDMIKQLLDFSRTSPSIQEPTSLTSCVKAAASLIKRMLPGNIEIVTEFEPGDFIVRANKTQLIQMLTNLAVNAQDAMPDGGKLFIKISRRSHAQYSGDLEPGSWCVLEVTDTGVGIADEILPHILEPFFTTKGPFQGTGLGLSQAYGIIKQHQGYLVVDSKNTEGASFFIFLPVLETTRAQISKIAPTHGGPLEDMKTVLLVDDESTVLDSGKEMIEALGYHALTARNGNDGLNICRQNQVDLIIVDLVMPVMGGEAMLDTLRKENKPFKALILSGYSPVKNWQEKFGNEVKEWISKPLNIETLEKSIYKALFKSG
jgi:PAS domain S-box-containing protein